jgi:exonuclease SbcC
MTTQTATAPPPIAKIILHNIQCYLHVEIEPAPPGEMTVLIGESDSGKTTLGARAHLKLGFDDASTKDMIRKGAKKGHISYIYDTPDNLTASWHYECPIERTSKKPNPEKAKTWYEIARDGADTITLEGGGKGVPQAIQDITGLRLVQIGATKLNLNISKQLGGPFLGDKSPNERYRVLGILAGTLEVDAAVKEVGTEIIRARRQETVYENEIKSLEDQVNAYSWLEALGRAIEKVQAAFSEVSERQGLRNKLQASLENIAESREIVQAAGAFIAVLDDVISRANFWLAVIESKLHIYRKLVSIHANITAQKEILSRAEAILKTTEHTSRGQLILAGTERALTHSGRLEKLSRDIKAEESKLTSAQNILTLTRTHQDALRAVGQVAESYHKYSILMSCSTGITKEQAAIKRYAEIISRTSATDQGKEFLAGVVATVSTLKKLRGLAAEIRAREAELAGAENMLRVADGNNVTRAKDIISMAEADISRLKKLRESAGEIRAQEDCRAKAETVLQATESIGQVSTMITFVQAFVGRLNMLRTESALIENSLVSIRSAESKITALDVKIEKAAGEYRALLLQAGICENCQVVDAVMAAAG